VSRAATSEQVLPRNCLWTVEHDGLVHRIEHLGPQAGVPPRSLRTICEWAGMGLPNGRPWDTRDVAALTGDVPLTCFSCLLYSAY